MSLYLYTRLRAEVAELRRRIADLASGITGGASAHATSHASGGSDAIKLDDLAPPDDNTDLNATTSAHGLLPKLPGGTSTFLRGDGTFAGASGGGGDWTRIEEQTPSGTGTITFSSLGSYTHLEIHWSARSDKASVNTEEIGIQFNGDTGNNYDIELLYNSSNTAAAAAAAFGVGNGTCGIMPAATATANRSGGGVITIPDYRGTTFHKTISGRVHTAVGTSAGSLLTRVYGSTWRDASAITSVRLFLGAGNYVAGTKFTLYGLT